jgi:hypothetical protein
MRTKRIFTILTVIVLLALLTTTVYASSSFQPSTAHIVGTWNMTIAESETAPEGLEVLMTFFADGNYMETINNLNAGSTAHGVWMGSGNTYLYNFQVFTFDEQGNGAGKRIIRGSIRMDGPDHITGSGAADLIDVDGKVTENAFVVTIEATRMEVELPGMP